MSATAAIVRPGSGRSSKKHYDPSEARAGLILALPFTILFAIFMIWPVIQSMFMSFTDTRVTDVKSPFNVAFVGFDNFVRALGDPLFQRAAINTAVFVVIGVPVTIAVALLVAIVLDKGIKRFRNFFRVGFYTPVITSIVAVAVVWKFLYQPDSGLINTMLGWIGIDGPNWLGDERTALISLIIMAAWRNFGTAMLIFLAGLQAVPPSLLEAAALDGANAWQRFRNITLPTLRPTMLFVMVTTTIGYMQFFEEPFVMTDGGPLNSTLSVSLYTYRQFGFGNFGLSSAMAYITFIVVIIVTIVQFRVTREKN